MRNGNTYEGRSNVFQLDAVTNTRIMFDWLVNICNSFMIFADKTVEIIVCRLHHRLSPAKELENSKFYFRSVG